MAMTTFITLKQKPNFIYGYMLDLGSPSVIFVLEINGKVKDLDISAEAINATLEALSALEVTKLETLKGADSDLGLQLIKALIEWNTALHKAAGWAAVSGNKSMPVRRIDKNGLFSITVPCADGHQLYVSQAFQWLMNMFNKILSHEDLSNSAKELKRVISNLAVYAPQGLNSKNFIESAVKLGIPWRNVQQNVVQYGWGSQSHWMDSSFTENTSLIATRLVRNKFSAAAILKSAGIPVPEHRVVTDVESAVKAATKLGYPIVVKPINQDGGNGVAAGLNDENLVRQAFAAAKKFSKEVLIEKHVAGNDYRLQVFRGKLVWVSYRQPAGVMGDGKSTIKKLLETLNQEPLRGEPGSNALLKRIHLDDEANALLAEQNVKLSTKPKVGEFIRLRRTANVASGGRPMIVDLADVHADNQKLVELAARTLRLDMAGVDLIIPDIKQSWLSTGAAICEVNAQPQVWPQLTTELLKKMTRGQGRIPVIFALGTQQHQHWISTLADSIGKLGCRVGVAEKNQAKLGADVVMHNSQNVLQSAQALLMNKQVDCLLVCVDDTELANLGLPCDKFDILILLDAPDGNNKQKMWLDFARLLSRGCTGISLINQESQALNSILDLINKDTVKPMKLDQIQKLVIDSFQKGLKKTSAN